MNLGRLALARGTVDRAADHRRDAQWLARAWADPRTRVLVVDDGRAFVRFYGAPDEGGAGNDGRRPGSGGGAHGGGAPGGGAHDDNGAELILVPPAEAPDGARIFLGVDAAAAYFAVLGRLGTETAPSAPPGGVVRRAGLRAAGALLNDRDAGLLTHTVALANWHSTHTHCPRCGARTRLSDAGHTRVCPEDGSEHFPRVDPAVIMLVLDSAGRCLLARNLRWPEKRVSILAGFVEPGESVEQAVAREVREEVGLTVGDLRYLGSQPWPMPQSLMLGFSARVSGPSEAGGTRQGGAPPPIRVDTNEIAEAHWYSRDDLRVAIGAGQILLPSPVSIAHRIIESWYGGPLPKAW